MPAKKISQLNPAITPLGATDVLPLSQADGVTRKAQISDLGANKADHIVVTLDANSTANPSAVDIGYAVVAIATVYDINNTVLQGKVITWTSSDATKASVDVNSGVVTGIALGSVVITATCDSVITGTITLAVQAAPYLWFRPSRGDNFASLGTTVSSANKTYWDANGIVRTVGANVPRDRHVVNGRTGLLIEGLGWQQQTLQTEDFSNAAWTKTSCTIDAGSVVGPDGNTYTGVLGIKPAQGNITLANGTLHVFQGGYTTVGLGYVMTGIFVKFNMTNILLIQFKNRDGSFTNNWFNAATNTWFAHASATTSPVSYQLGNGWWFLSVSNNAITNLNNNPMSVAYGFVDSTSNTNSNASGQNIAGWLWGGQFVSQMFGARSYVKATTVPVTVVDDVLKFTISGWTPGEKTIYSRDTDVGGVVDASKTSEGNPMMWAVGASTAAASSQFFRTALSATGAWNFFSTESTGNYGIANVTPAIGTNNWGDQYETRLTISLATAYEGAQRFSKYPGTVNAVVPEFCTTQAQPGGSYRVAYSTTTVCLCQTGANLQRGIMFLEEFKVHPTVVSTIPDARLL